MIEALIAGQRDPQALARLARGRMKVKHAALVQALTGRFGDHHGELARMLLDQYDALTAQIGALTGRIEELIGGIPEARGVDAGGETGPGAGEGPGAAGSSLPSQGGPPLSLAVPGAVFFAGIDWAAETQAVCVMDAAGQVVARFCIAHSAEELDRLVRRLAGLGDPGDIPVAIERPSGWLVDVLLEAGHPVVPVSPNAIKTWRDGEVLSGAKSDAGDAEVIAEYLRLRQHRLRVATPYSDQEKALRTGVRTRDDLVEMRVAAVNQLAALLDAHWPGAKTIFADLESRISLEFLTRYPTAASAARLSEQDIAAFRAELGYSGKRPAAVLLDRLRSAPAGTTGEALTTAVRDAVLALVSVLKAVTAAVKDLDRSVAARLSEHPDGKIFTSLPRSGQINAA